MEPGAVIKTFTSKKGHQVVFRYLKAADLDAMLDYINALIEEDTYIGLYGKKLTREEEQKVLDEALADMKSGTKAHVVVEVDGVYAGNAEVRGEKVRRKKHVGELGISLAAAYREEGIGSMLMQTLIDEGKKMGLRLLVLNCFENNPLALHVYEKLGFQRAGVVPGAIAWKDGYVGEVKFYLPLM